MIEFSEQVLNHVRETAEWMEGYAEYHKIISEQCWKCFEKFCAIAGKDKTDFPDFEFWWMRIARGEEEMSYDRSLDPKTRTFTDLPVNTLEKITQDFDLMDRLIVRYVNKALQALIDPTLPDVQKIVSIKILEPDSELKIDDHVLKYMNWFKKDRSFRTVEANDCSFVGHDALFGQAHGKQTIDHLAVFLKNSKEFKLTRFEVRSAPYDTDDVIKMLSSLEVLKIAPMHAETVYLGNVGLDAWKVLKYFKPEVLEYIHLPHRVLVDGLESEEFRQMEQLKNIKMLYCFDYMGFCGDPCVVFEKFPRASLVLRTRKTAKQIAVQLQTLVKFTALETFNYKHENAPIPVQSILKLLGTDFLKVKNRKNIRRHKIPNSEQFYEIEFTEEKITIKREE